MIGKPNQSIAQSAINDALSLLDMVRNVDRYEEALRTLAEASDMASQRILQAEEIERSLTSRIAAAEQAEANAAVSAGIARSEQAQAVEANRLQEGIRRDLEDQARALAERQVSIDGQVNAAMAAVSAREAAVAAREEAAQATRQELAAKEVELDEARAAVDAQAAELARKLEALRNAASAAL